MEIALNRKVELEGNWGLPSTPNEVVHGVLSYEPGSALRLNLNDFLKLPLALGEKFEFIHGTTEAGSVILEDCVFDAKSEGFSMTLTIGTAFLGVPRSATVPLKWNALSVQYSGLNAWALSGGLHTLNPAPELIQTAESDSWRIEIRIEFPNTPSEISPGGREGEPEVWLDVFPIDNQPTSLSEFLDVEHILRYFFSLMMNDAVFPTRLVASLRSSSQDRHAKDLGDVDILARFARYPTHIPEPPWWRIEMFFPWVWQNWSAAISNWLNRAKELEIVFHLFFSIRYNPAEYLDSQFLFLTQALEAYHRRVFGGAYMTEQAYVANVLPTLVKAIPDSVSQEHRKSLKSRLHYGYEYSQRYRFKQIFKQLAQHVPVGFLAQQSAISRVADRIVDVRNDMTHFDPNSEITSASTQEILDLKSKLSLVLETLMLLDVIKLPSADVAQLMKLRYHLD